MSTGDASTSSADKPPSMDAAAAYTGAERQGSTWLICTLSNNRQNTLQPIIPKTNLLQQQLEKRADPPPPKIRRPNEINQSAVSSMVSISCPFANFVILSLVYSKLSFISIQTFWDTFSEEFFHYFLYRMRLTPHRSLMSRMMTTRATSMVTKWTKILIQQSFVHEAWVLHQGRRWSNHSERQH